LPAPLNLGAQCNRGHQERNARRPRFSLSASCLSFLGKFEKIAGTKIQSLPGTDRGRAVVILLLQWMLHVWHEHSGKSKVLGLYASEKPNMHLALFGVFASPEHCGHLQRDRLVVVALGFIHICAAQAWTCRYRTIIIITIAVMAIWRVVQCN
jgi:hypothetical protein